MANVGYATLTIIPSAKNFASNLRKETGAPLAAVGKRSGADAGKGFGGAFIGSVKPMLGALGGIFAAQKIGGFFTGAITEASNLNESVNALNVVYGKSSKGIQALGREAAQGLGLSNLDFNNLAVQFSNFAKTVAGPGGNVVSTIDDLTTRASDFASVMNLDVAEAATLFQSGLAGETEPLRRFGIDLSAAAVEAYAYANGIAQAGSELTESEKVQARYGLLMQSTAQTAGDFRNTQDSLANVQRRIGASWADLTAKLGAGFLPILERALGFVNSTVLPGLEGLGGTIRGIFDSFGSGGGGGAISGFLAALAPLGTTITEQILPALISFGQAFMTGIQPVLQAIGGIITGSVIPALTNMATMAQPLLAKVAETFRVLGQTVGPILQGIANIITTVWGFIGPFVIQIVQGIFQNVVGVFTGLLDVIQGVVRLVSAIFTGDWAAAWDAVKQIVSGAVTAVWNFIQLWLVGRVVGLVRSGLGMVRGLFTNIWNGILGFFRGIGTNIGNFARSMMDTVRLRVMYGLDAVKAFFSNIWGGIVSFVSGIGSRIAGTVGSFIGRVRSTVSGGLSAVRSFFSTAWNAAVNFVRNAFSRIVSSVSSGVSNVMSFIRGLPGKIASALGNLGGLLVSAGRAIIDGLLSGLRAAWDKVTGFVGGIASWIAENKGPLPYDRRLLVPAGIAIMEGLSNGLQSQLGSLKSTLGTITGSVVGEVEKGVRDGSRKIALASEGLVPRAPSFRSPTISADGSVVGAVTTSARGNQIILNGIKGDPDAFADALTFAMHRASRGGVHSPGGTR